MKNIFLILIPSFFVCACAIGNIIYHIVKKPKYYLAKTLFLVAVLVALLMLEFPLYMDIFANNTTTVTAEYVGYQSSNTELGTYKAFFEGRGGRFYVYIPMYTWDITKMEEGKIYEIEYFDNSCVMKEYKLIE